MRPRLREQRRARRRRRAHHAVELFRVRRHERGARIAKLCLTGRAAAQADAAVTMRAMTPAPSDPQPAAPTRWPGQLASIDIGSNSFRLEIGQVIQGRYRRIDYLKDTVRLGAGLDRNGMLTEEAAARGLACLARFAQRLEGYVPSQVRAVATQTLREARNRDEFL